MTAELIEIQNNNGIQVVNVRELYEKLGLDKSHIARWLDINIKNNQFAIEHEDWEGFAIEANGNQVENYWLSIDFAKRLCMMTRTEKGEHIRKYFIECEKVAKQATITNDVLPTRIDSKFMLAVSQRMAELETNVQQLTVANDEKQEFIEVIQDSGKSRVYKKNLMAECNRIAKIINAKYDIPFKDIWDRAYKLLFNQHFVDWKYEFYQAQNKLSFLALKDICYLKDLKDILIAMSKPDKTEITA